MLSRSPKRFKITIPYRGSPHSVVVSLPEWPATTKIVPVTLPNGEIVHIERSELDLLVRCGMAKEVP